MFFLRETCPLGIASTFSLATEVAPPQSLRPTASTTEAVRWSGSNVIEEGQA